MRHPAFHVSTKLVRSVSSVTGFLRQCEVKILFAENKNAANICLTMLELTCNIVSEQRASCPVTFSDICRKNRIFWRMYANTSLAEARITSG